MQLKFKIIETHPDIHSIVVRYYSNDLTEEQLCTFFDNASGRPVLTKDGTISRCKFDMSITFYKLPVPTGQDLINYIAERAPIEALNLESMIRSPAIDTSLSTIASVRGTEFTKSIDLSPPARIATPQPTDVVISPIVV